MWTSSSGAAPSTPLPYARSAWEISGCCSAAAPFSQPPTTGRRHHDRTKRRRAMVDLGARAAERAPHLRRVHLHAVRNGQAVRVSGRHHAGRWHGARRVAGWPGLHPGVVRGRVTPRRAVHPSRRLSAGRRDGGGLFHRPRVARFLDGAQSGHARGDLLLRVAVPLGRRRRPVEPRRADRPLATERGDYCVRMRTEAGSRPSAAAVRVTAPARAPARMMTSAFPLKSCTRSPWNRAWLIWSPLSTATIRASPASRKRTSWPAVGTATPARSSTVTVTNERSAPSARIAARSGASAMRAGAPAVFTSAVAITAPPLWATARSVPGAYGTRHIRWSTSPSFRCTPSETPFRNNSTSSALP